MYEGLAPGRRADRGNVRRSIGRRADGGRRTTKGNGGGRTERSFYFVLVIPKNRLTETSKIEGVACIYFTVKTGLRY